MVFTIPYSYVLVDYGHQNSEGRQEHGRDATPLC